jgi:hypothetical protein
MIQRTAAIFVAGSVVLGAIAVTPGCGGEQPAEVAPADPSATGAPGRSVAPPGATVFIFSPQDGATVSSPVNVKFGVSGVSVVPAGDMQPNSGHHHLLIDTELPDASLPIPADDRHLHFGKGQTETTIELRPGPHTLQLVLGDGRHIPHQPPIVSKVVTITVE